MKDKLGHGSEAHREFHRPQVEHGKQTTGKDHHGKLHHGQPHVRFGGASIEREPSGKYSIYRSGNPYATTGGFKSPKEAVEAIKKG